MKTKYFILVLSIFLIGLVNAGMTDLGVFKQNECIELQQTCGNCTYNNISSIIYPNATEILSNVEMTRDDTHYNYTFCDTDVIGEYVVSGFGNPYEVKMVWNYGFTVSPSGKRLTTGESILYVVLILILFLFVVLLFYFIIALPKDNEKDDGGEIIKIIRLKYLRILFIALLYPLMIIVLNLMNGLAISFTLISMFSGTIGFLFEVMLRGAWVFTLIMVLWVLYSLIKDSNVKKNIKRMGRFRLHGH